MRSPATAAALTALLAGCGGASSGPSGPAPELELGLEHVHGLGVDPADGVLYAATHFGVFRLPEGQEPVRVAERFQDTMAFTVVGPRTFLASGHPDFRKDPDLPPRLGLIRSADAAQTWQPVSLTGTADLHALRSAAGTLYAADSTAGTLLASADDGVTWEVRSSVAALDLAVRPDDPQVVVLTSPGGALRSTDGGRTLAPLSAPALVMLGWESPDALYGIDAGGQVHASGDGGASWQARGALGAEPEALAVVDGVLYAAADGRGILQSRDGGASWTVRYAGD